jgi:A/G-specific adenine glycosylase
LDKIIDKHKIFPAKLIDWYRIHQRALPWRETTDPYKIWLSEIILQQTRVAQGMDYYLRFTEAFPTVKELAAAEESAVLKLWQGLGYYSRARNLHATARFVSDKLHGVFPQNYEEILTLKGVGPYTAAAISSFAFGEKKAVVDGNVLRVLSRIAATDLPIDSGKGRKCYEQFANALIPDKNPGEYNQAIMEFGAMQCVPKNPDCKNCFYQEHCGAYQQGLVNQLPVKQGKTQVKKVYFLYFIIECEGQLLVNHRHTEGIWKNLYDFPLIEVERKVGLQKIPNLPRQEWEIEDFTVEHISDWHKHLLSHRSIHARFTHLRLKEIPLPMKKKFRLIRRKEWHHLPVPKLIENYMSGFFK